MHKTATSGDVTLYLPCLKGVSSEMTIIVRYHHRESSVKESLIKMTEDRAGAPLKFRKKNSSFRKIFVNLSFENTPLNGVAIEKYDNVTGAALSGCIVITVEKRCSNE